jgi:3-deoxy-7-phosphoheptulonate synthase
VTGRIIDAHITGATVWDAPEKVWSELPMEKSSEASVLDARQTVADIIHGKDERMLVVAGPCSIHEERPVLEYAHRLAELAHEFRGKAFFVMRACFEKPRSISRAIDWPGLIMDPELRLDGTHDFNAGIRKARTIAHRLADTGMPLAMEILDPDTVQYIGDYASFVWTGARTVLTPNNRRVGSGLSMPAGFKNEPDGTFAGMLDAVESASHPNSFYGIDATTGRKATFKGDGNPDAFPILRGGRSGPNHDSVSMNTLFAEIEKRNLNRFALIDASHGNSKKDPTQQTTGFGRAVQYRRHAHLNVGVMIESYLREGAQKPHEAPRVPGRSVTDACMSWEATEALVREQLNLL